MRVRFFRPVQQLSVGIPREFFRLRGLGDQCGDDTEVLLVGGGGGPDVEEGEEGRFDLCDGQLQQTGSDLLRPCSGDGVGGGNAGEPLRGCVSFVGPVVPVHADGGAGEARAAVECSCVAGSDVDADVPQPTPRAAAFSVPACDRLIAAAELGCCLDAYFDRGVLEVGGGEQHHSVLAAGACAGERLLQEVGP
jgi:hypothetical protein